MSNEDSIQKLKNVFMKSDLSAEDITICLKELEKEVAATKKLKSRQKLKQDLWLMGLMALAFLLICGLQESVM